LAPQWQQQALRADRSADATRATARSLRARASAGQPQRWQDRLPPASARDERLAALLRLAPQHELLLPAATQRLADDGAGTLARLQVDLAMQGSYANLRRFLEAALAQDPALVLEQLQFSRREPGADGLEASLRFMLLGRAAGPAATLPEAGR
jgi:hypothetical protein